MNDTPEASAQEAGRWLLLIHQLPREPAYVRVKVRRRLHRLGAMPLKNSVYVMPYTEVNLEDFQWLANEIIGDGGEAAIFAASPLSGLTDTDLRGEFDLAVPAPKAAQAVVDPRPKGAVWVTRKNVFVDRMASAWLIRRFIDSRARFRFVSARGYKKRPGELRFDMYQGEYTHVGDRCTFETLLGRFDLRDGALGTMAQIIHDIDLKDAKFGRPEATGIAAVLNGIVLETADDSERLERAVRVFDDLYRHL